MSEPRATNSQPVDWAFAYRYLNVIARGPTNSVIFVLEGGEPTTERTRLFTLAQGSRSASERNPRPLPTSRVPLRPHRCVPAAPVFLQPLIERAFRGPLEALPCANKQRVRKPSQRRKQGARAGRHPATAARMTIRRFQSSAEFSSVSRATIDEGRPNGKASLA